MNLEPLLAWYREHGRAHLPWRRTRDPYRILVAETMLQQTQVERVIPLYEAFVAAFPNFAALAAAHTGDVIRLWRGLGYNSRAVRLHDLARAVVREHDGALPRATDALRALPGIGPYTASAVRAFAFEADDVAIDTNLRRVAHRVAYGIEHPPRASIAELDAVLRDALPAGRAHDANSALMDLGATICTARAPKCLVCPLRAQCAAAPLDAPTLAAAARVHAKAPSPQNAIPFEQTTRYLRGRVVDALRDVPAGVSLLVEELPRLLGDALPAERLDDIPAVLDALARDGVIVRNARSVRLT